MIGRVVLVTQPDEGRQLSAILSALNPALDIHVATSLEEVDRALVDTPAKTRLVTALTDVLIPAEILDRLELAGYNFHPGPPSHPGKYPAAFALYDEVEVFGATAHELASKIDSGPIVAIESTRVPEGADIGWFHDHAYRLFMRLFLRLAPHLAISTEPLAPLSIAWGERYCSRRALRRITRIPQDIASEELQRRIRAFGHLRHMPLTIDSLGYQWIITDDTQ